MTDAKEKSVSLSPGETERRLEYLPEEKEEVTDIFPDRELVGCLLYLAVCTRPDISYAVASLARFVSNPR